MKKNKIKVLHLICMMNDAGAQKIVMNYLNDFNNDEDIEMRVLVYSNISNSNNDKKIEKENYKVDYLFKGINNRFLRKICKIFFGRNKIKNYIKQYNPDIVHVHISGLLNIVLKPIVSCNVPLRFNTLHSNPLRYQGKTLRNIRDAYKKYNFIPICVTNEQVNVAKKHYGFSKYEVLYNGIDFESITKKIIDKRTAREKFNISMEDYVIIGVGRLERIKRFDYLIEIFEKVYKKNKKAKLIFAGSGNKKNSLIKLVKKYNLEDKVRFIGNIENIVELYCAADVMAITSESESSSLVLLESQICGLYNVISYDVPSESIISNKVKKMDKNSSIDDWAQSLVRCECNEKKINNYKDYEVHDVSKKLKQIYLKYMKEYENKKYN